MLCIIYMGGGQILPLRLFEEFDARPGSVLLCEPGACEPLACEPCLTETCDSAAVGKPPKLRQRRGTGENV